MAVPQITHFFITTLNRPVEVFVGDTTTVAGTVTAISGSGSQATVSVTLTTGDAVSVKASSCYVPSGTGAAVGQGGNHFGVGSNVTIPGNILSIAGTTTANLCRITLQTFNENITINGTSQAIPNAQQTASADHTWSQAEIDAGYARVVVTFAIPFADTKYAALTSIIDIDDNEALDFYQGDIHLQTAGSCDVTAYCYTPGQGVAGSRITVNVSAVHF